MSEVSNLIINNTTYEICDEETRNAVGGDAFSEDVYYYAGDYCIQDNQMYKFTVDHPEGPWIGEKVTTTTTDEETGEEVTTEEAGVVEAVSIMSELASLNGNLTAEDSTAFRFGVDDGKYGYYTTDEAGADTFNPFSNITSLSNLTLLATLTGDGTVKCTGITGYKSLTKNNFIVMVTGGASGSSSSSYAYYGTTAAAGFTVSKSYSASSGTLTVSGLTQSVYQLTSDGGSTCSFTQKMTAKIYLIS